MMPIEEKKDAFQRAVKLLSDGDVSNLRYVVLEVRRCLEAVAYEKLFAYKDRIPLEVAKKWQPPQAFKALIALEPDAGRSSVIRYAQETVPGVQAKDGFIELGRDIRPSKDLLKEWHKLGKFLHASYPFEAASDLLTAELQSYLSGLIDKLKPFVDNSFTSTIANIVTLECVVCKSWIGANSTGAENLGYVTCLHPACEARHNVEIKDGEIVLLAPEICEANCPECQNEIVFPKNKLEAGFSFSCSQCDTLFEVSKEWQFHKVDQDTKDSSEERRDD